MFQVAEIFESINGEGPRAGQLALFIRMRGCNLSCAYCDTAWANRDDAAYEELSTEEMINRVRRAGIRHVTLTGGEPLQQAGIAGLLTALAAEPEIRVEVETNGSVDLARILAEMREIAERTGGGTTRTEGDAAGGLSQSLRRPSFTMDYKLPGSGMEERMRPENFAVLTGEDTVKFVVADRTDLDRAREMITRYDLTKRCRVYLSPVFGAIEAAEIADYMKEYRLNDVTLQLQLHKMIWGAEQHGV